MKNIVFSTTRQWNPGDEIILEGVRRIFDAVGEIYNPIIYNRNPDVRSMHQDHQLFKTSRVPATFWKKHETRLLEANLKFGFFDNSLKPDTDCRFVDWAVLSGTPEWCNARMCDLYAQVVAHNLPVMILGVGGGFNPYNPTFREVIGKAKTFIVRDRGTLEAVQAGGFPQAQLMPCPALLSAPPSFERQVKRVRKIGLIYHATAEESIIWNGFSNEAFAGMKALYQKLQERFGRDYEIEMVCHYIDELPLAKRDFPDMEIHYSYKAIDYFAIYGQFDFVVGPRVHGIGTAASMGIPGIAMAHDARGSTCEGFLADIITDFTDTAGSLRLIAAGIEDVVARSQKLLRHKQDTMTAYCDIVRQALTDTTVSYSAPELVQKRPPYILEKLARPLKWLVGQSDGVLAHALAGIVHAKDAETKGELQKDESILLSALFQKMESMEDEIKSMGDEIDQLHASTSWKITAPLRWLKSKAMGSSSAGDRT